ncbi:hypothetical protein U1Q18_010653 [Sarracenia purpurea var. burkii]
MEQGRRTEEDMRQRQDQRRRLTPSPPSQSENQLHQHLHQQPPPQQKCPRCDSLNTKFCYYNNYSLTQPRYFCKACRRYWTQGGTLRNVPVGGGCRKGKRPRASSSGGGENSRSQQPLPSPRQPPRQPQHEHIHLPQNSGAGGAPPNLALRDKELGNLASNHAMDSYYPGGGFLSSLSAVQPVIRMPPPPQPFSQPSNAGGQFGGSGSGSSHLPLLHGLNAPSFGTQNEFYQMGNREKNIEIEPLYPSDQSLIQPNRPVVSWINQTLINNPNASTTSFWNGSATNNRTPGSGSSLNPNQWPDLPGYGHPP